jgi:tRNA threonylcarbamoyladenosine biosynthesis protein TsaB
VNLLAIETSSRTGSVALACEDDVTETVIEEPREQSGRLLPAIDALLQAAGVSLDGLDAVAFGRGPGSFTGLRVAAAFAQGFGLARGVPLVAVSSLAVAAQRAWREHGVRDALVAVDARMGEVYWAEVTVADGSAVARGEERLGAPECVAVPAAGHFAAVGDAFAAHAEALAELRAAADGVFEELVPGARDLLTLARAELAAGRRVAPEQAVPVYLRDESAWRRAR